MAPLGSPRLAVRIAGTASFMPGRPTTTAELVESLPTRRDPQEVIARTGIASRWFAEAAVTKADIGTVVLDAALQNAELRATDLKRVLFVNSHGGDVLVPATANRVVAALGLAGDCDCFDLNNACMGFLSAFDVAARSVATGIDAVAVVVVEMGSRYITPEDPRPYLVCADAAAAVILTKGRENEGVVESWLRNDGTIAGEVTLDHPGLTGKRETIRFGAPNRHISELALEGVRRSADAVLRPAGLTIDEIEWVVPHQPNGSLLRAMVEILGVAEDRFVPVVQEIGSVGAAAIPVSLDRLMRTRPVKTGDRVLMIGVGAGAAYGAILHRVG